MAPITTRYDASSTADQVVAGADLTGVRAIVTGASSGIGVETARSLARAGAAVTLAVRDEAAGRRVAADIAGPDPGRVTVERLDLADRASVAAFTDRWTGPLHLLINNAGLIVRDLTRTPEGWELQFATNHLGRFALAVALHEALAAGARQRGENSRIVAVSSTAHMRSPVVFDDLHFDRRPYHPQSAYAQSKTANSLFAVEATRRWQGDGIVANTANPGGVATGLQRDFTQQQKDYLAAAEAAGAFTYKTTQQGAATTLVAAVAPEFGRTGGHYLDDGREAHTVPDDADLFANSHGVKEWALDPDAAARLWTVSRDLITS